MMVPFANKQALKRKIPKCYDKQQQLELVLVALGAYLDALGMPRKRHKHLQSFNPQNLQKILFQRDYNPHCPTRPSIPNIPLHTLAFRCSIYYQLVPYFITSCLTCSNVALLLWSFLCNLISSDTNNRRNLSLVKVKMKPT
jgi:hypothetical protein